MGLVKLEIDGKRVIAEGGQTILEAARDNGIDTIPTLCHDRQLEPFSSCYICVVKVQGRARYCRPARPSRGRDERRDRQHRGPALAQGGAGADAVEPLRRLHRPLPDRLPRRDRHPGLHRARRAGEVPRRNPPDQGQEPAPAICGRVCTRPCEVSGCRRNLLDQAVGIDYIKRYLADLELGRVDAPKLEVAPPNGKRVAVVGAGPAGLSCAYYLALCGFSVQIFEKMPEAGGMLRYGIPEYRLPKEILDLEVNQILDLGVTLSTNVALGEDFTVRSLREEQGFDAVFLGIGAWTAPRCGSRTSAPRGPLRDRVPQELRPAPGAEAPWPRRVVGGGNTAIDCARTALRVGAERVTILYRRTRTRCRQRDRDRRGRSRGGWRCSSSPLR